MNFKVLCASWFLLKRLDYSFLFSLSQIVNSALFRDQVRLIFYIISISVNLGAVSHTGGTKQGRGESSGKFASKPLEDLSWRGLIKRVFEHLQHVNCPCGKKNFPSPDALIRHIERTHPEDADSVTFCAHTTLDRSTSPHRSVVTELKRKYGEGKVSKEFCPNCGRKFQCQTQGVFENGGAIQVYSDDTVCCDDCAKYDVEQS